ncbi:hypothetical protein [Lacimicrobium sp. SS2-24]|uniref:hypothetical protein n=1 Tax=Lacimicrobium sp. SS2-24 TaxID=2005569 RepID=UPI000B4ACE1C|nr:hypothetical protein [Lacimicrobium sp. SS2-24]
MSHHQYILSLCQSLAESGKTPSVALIKSHARQPLPLPDILSVLQKWKKNPKVRLPEEEQPVAKPPSHEQRITSLEARIEKLETLLSQLLEQQNNRR